jgi:hypothetical protein
VAAEIFYEPRLVGLVPSKLERWSQHLPTLFRQFSVNSFDLLTGMVLVLVASVFAAGRSQLSVEFCHISHHLVFRQHAN